MLSFTFNSCLSKAQYHHLQHSKACFDKYNQFGAQEPADTKLNFMAIYAKTHICTDNI